MATKHKGSVCVPVSKRKKVVLSLIKKIEILDKLVSGSSASAVAREYNMNESTVCSIKKKEVEIRKSVKEAAPQSAKVTSVVRDIYYEKMEERLNLWIEEMVARKSVVDGMALRQQALEIYEHVTRGVHSPKPFTASKGWLERFKNRYCLHNIKLSGEAGSADKAAADAFVPVFSKVIEEKGYTSEQVFNVDETGLFYKQVGSRTYITKTVSKSPGFKAYKDRASLLLATNAKGDFKCKPLLMYRAENPQALKGKDKCQLPVYWRANRKAWMSGKFFLDWLKNCFVPEVEIYLHSKNLSFKVLLTLDNAPVHCKDEIKNAHPNVEILFMPPNTSALIQPLDQGIIKAFKSYYTRNVYKAAIQELATDVSLTMLEYWKKLNICIVIDFIQAAWKEVSQTTINNCWKNLWEECVTNVNVVDEANMVVKDIVRMAKEIGGEGFEDMREEEVEDIINAKVQEPTLNELDELAKDSSDISDGDKNDEDSNQVTEVKMFSSVKLSELLTDTERLCKKFQEFDPILERSLKFTRLVETALLPYVEVMKYLKRQAKQTTLMQFFTTCPPVKEPDTS